MNAEPLTRSEIFDEDWDPDAHWSTTNLSEAMPGVPTPLSWTLWRPPHERGVRAGFAAIGALERSRTIDPPNPRDRWLGSFYGRTAAKVEFLGEMGDRLPGTSGAAIAEQFLGKLPEGFESRSTPRRLPAIAVRFPVAMRRTPKTARDVAARTHSRWTQLLAEVTSMGLPDARRAWLDAGAWFETAFTSHTCLTLATAQPAYDQVLRLAASAGRPDLGGKVLAGLGSHTELKVVSDLWSLSRDEITLERFLDLHGYHGPYEGELSSHPWREDPSPVAVIRDRYAATPSSDSPMEQQRRLAADTAGARAELLDALPRVRRPPARLVLGLADRYVGYRGLGKASFVQALDSCRAVARRIGGLLAEEGVLSDPEDVFFLTSSELMSDDRTLASRVPERREWRARCEALHVPGAWRGRPAVTSPNGAGDAGADADGRLSGIGASPGVVEGRIRIVTDPTFAEVEAGEVLVAPVTDPAWAPIMFVSSALVVEIGGLLSHAAVVAREMGIPCVMGISDATSRLRTGDLCRIDGDAGTVEIVERAAG